MYVYVCVCLFVHVFGVLKSVCLCACVCVWFSEFFCVICARICICVCVCERVRVGGGEGDFFCACVMNPPRHNATLHALHLQGNEIGDIGAAAIGEGLRCVHFHCFQTNNDVFIRLISGYAHSVMDTETLAL